MFDSNSHLATRNATSVVGQLITSARVRLRGATVAPQTSASCSVFSSGAITYLREDLGCPIEPDRLLGDHPATGMIDLVGGGSARTDGDVSGVQRHVIPLHSLGREHPETG